MYARLALALRWCRKPQSALASIGHKVTTSCSPAGAGPVVSGVDCFELHQFLLIPAKGNHGSTSILFSVLPRKPLGDISLVLQGFLCASADHSFIHSFSHPILMCIYYVPGFVYTLGLWG